MQGIRRACYKGVVEYRPENGDKERGGENEKIKRFSGDIGMRILWSIKKRFQAFGLVRGGGLCPGAKSLAEHIFICTIRKLRI